MKLKGNSSVHINIRVHSYSARDKTEKTEEQQLENAINTMAEHSFEQELVGLVCTVTLKLPSETSAIASTDAKGIRQVENVEGFPNE